MPGTVEIETPRLLLRRHVMEDAAPLYESFGQDPAMYEYSGWNPYATPAQAEQTVSHFIESYRDPRFYGWAVTHDERLVGTFGAYDYDPQSNTIEIGMSIEKASWGKGFATEALSAVLRYLTDDEGIATVVAWCAADNIGSQRALEKAGMARVASEAGALEVGEATFDKLNYEYCDTAGKDA